MNKYQRRKLSWGLGLIFIGAIIMIYNVYRLYPTGICSLGSIGLLTCLISFPFGFLGFLIWIGGMGLLFRFSRDAGKNYFGD